MNWIETNKHGHLLFQKARWDDQKELLPTGKIIVDLKNPTAILKETGDNGLYLDIDKSHTQIVFCSSPMDALALRSTSEHHSSSIIVIGENTSEKTAEAIKYTIRRKNIVLRLAENLTATGQNLAAWMRENFAQVATLPLPNGYQNWLDYHRRARHITDPTGLRVARFQEKEIGPDEIAMEQ